MTKDSKKDKYKFPKKQITFVRDRYQVTIPEKIRKEVDWLEPQVPVEITLVDENTFTVRKYKQKEVDWNDVWKVIKELENEGENIDSTDFLRKDRDSR